MITQVDITLLPPALQKQVREAYRQALMQPDARLSYQDAAWLYGYSYESIRTYVCNGLIRTGGRKPNRWISHAAMRKYIGEKKKDGSPRHALKALQQELP